MRAASVSRKVSSTKNLEKFRHFLQAGKTLFSVVSYSLKGSGECSKNLCHAGGGELTHTKIAKYLVHLYFISEKSTKVRKIVLSGKVSCFFKRTKCPEDSLFSFPLKLMKVSCMWVHSLKYQPGFLQKLFSFEGFLP